MCLRIVVHETLTKLDHFMISYQMDTFPRYWTFVRGIHRPPVDFPHKRPVTRSFNFFSDPRLIKRLSKQSRRIDLRRHRVYYDVTATLTYLGLLMPYWDIKHTRRQQAITLTNVDSAWARFCGIHLRAISQKAPMNVKDTSFGSEITLLYLPPYLWGAIEFM